MAGQSITFDFLSRGAASLSRDFRSIGEDSALSSRGVKTLQDIIESLGSKEGRTAAESKLLAGALRQTGEAADRATAKAVLADAAIRRLGDDMKNVKPADVVVLTDKAAAKLTGIKAKAEELKAKFPEFTVKINDKVAKAELDLFAAEAARKLDKLDKQITGTGSALSGLKVNPGLVGPLLALVPALGTLTGVVAGVGVGLAGAFVAGGAALAAFGAVAKPVLTDALKASQAVNTAQSTYQATLKAGVPTAQAQARLQAANASAVLTYNAAIAGGANPAKALAAEHLALARNQLAYNTATNAGTFGAKAYAAEQKAIGKAYADLSPAQIALSKQLGNMANAWQNLKAAQTPVVAGALQPWLKSVTDLTKQLGPIIAAVAPVIAYLGTKFDALINSSAFKAFRVFIAGTGSAAVSAVGGTIIDLVKSFIILLPKFDPLIREAVGWISRLGPAVLAWSSSAKAAADIQAFIRFFSANGQVVGDLLKNIGAALKALAPGLTAGGAIELRVISDFFGLVAKLPKDVARPLTEVAGAALILSKLGVLKVGVQIVGAAAKWLTGGLVNLGGGAAAGAEIRAAMVSGGAAAAAEIRAAMAGGGAAGAAGGAAGAAKGALGGLSLGAIAGLAAGGAGIGAGFILAIRKAIESGWKGVLGILPGLLSGVGGILNVSATGWSNAILDKFDKPIRRMWDNLGHFLASSFDVTRGQVAGIAANLGRQIAGSFDQTRGQVAGIWNALWANTRAVVGTGVAAVAGFWRTLQAGTVLAYNTVRSDIAGAWSAVWTNTRNVVGTGVAAVAGFWRTLQSGVVSAYSTVRADIATAWNTIWTNTRNTVTAGIGAVVGFFQAMPGRVVTALRALGGLLSGAAKTAVADFLSGFTSGVGGVIRYVESFGKAILSALNKIFHFGSPSSVMHDMGANVVQGLLNGLHSKLPALDLKAKQIADAAKNALNVPSGGGPTSAGAGQAQAYAQSRLGAYGWGAAQMKPLILLWTQESGWNRFAYNASSGATGIPQALPYTKMPRAAWLPSQGGQASAGAQIDWGLNYIKGRYGSPAGAWAHEIANNWYDRGGWLMPGLTLARNDTGRPERVLSPGEDIGGGWGVLVAELRALRAEVRHLNATAAAIPAATGNHVGGAISGAAGAAGFRNRYSRGGA